MPEIQEQVEKFKEFIEDNYIEKLQEIVRKGKNSLNLDFQELAKFDLELSEQLIEEPEDTIKSVELAIENLDITKKDIKVRFYSLPKTQLVLVKDLRSSHLNKFIAIEGIVRRATDVRPQVTIAKFECPSCGNTITIPQIDTKFKEPTRCSCGRKGRFRMLSKELVDAQGLTIEETPESLDGGEQPKRLNIFLKEDLVEPRMEKKTTPGSKIRITGVLKEVPIQLRTGAQSIRYDLMMEANHIEPV